MQRLLILTVGKTHTGKSIFARTLAEQLPNSLIIDQDHHAAFLNTHYPELVPKRGTNDVKHALTQFISSIATERTDAHLIVCNANLSRGNRLRLLNEQYPPTVFHRIIVFFDVSDTTVLTRIKHSDRSSVVIRGEITYEALIQKQAVEPPEADEADQLHVIQEPNDVASVIQQIKQCQSVE